MSIMNEQNHIIYHGKFAIKQLTREFTIDLMRHSYFLSARQRGDVLNHGLRYEMFKAVKLFPRATRLVAYDTEEKNAIGFLYLEENTNWLYTIEYVFVDPNYRKMGLGTKLVNYAITLAKEKRAKKINLNVYRTSRAIDLYKRLGFREIGNTLLAQSYLSQSALSRVVKRAIVGQGCLTKLSMRKRDQLFELETNSRRNREMLFSIFQRCMNQKWIDYFEVNSDNLINGSRHVWQPRFFKDVLINNSADSFALLFNLPFSHKATIEFYRIEDGNTPFILENLLRILVRRGISFAQISFVNPGDNVVSNWFKEKNMMIFNLVTMGKTL